MRILSCHNFYQQPGGEDRVYQSEARLLEEHGHDVVRYEVHNDRVGEMGWLRLGVSTVWNRERSRHLRAVIRHERPDVMHVHNTLPLLSPAVYHAAHLEGVPVVQTLHNFRLCCPKAVLFRDGHVCADCLGRTVAWPAVLHGCYRGSRPATAAVTTMLAVHRGIGTWQYGVDAYIALSEFARRMFIRQHLPVERIFVKRNAVSPDPGIGDGGDGGVVFVGRLSPEKGVATLIAAWEHLPDVRLTILGDGPLAASVREAARHHSAIRLAGYLAPAEVLEAIGRAACLVCPSECYEGSPLVVAEAFARGTPVIATRTGALEEMVTHGVTGALYPPGDARQLATAVRQLLGDGPRLAAMRRAARAEFDATFSPRVNYESLMNVYRHAVAARRGLAPDWLPAQ